MAKIRTRFAPNSEDHVGNLRTALYARLQALKVGDFNFKNEEKICRPSRGRYCEETLSSGHMCFKKDLA